MSVRVYVRDQGSRKEPLGIVLRRFKKLVERNGIMREMRKHEHYRKPSEVRREKRLRQKHNQMKESHEA